MKICVLCFGFKESNLRLQPWRYVFEMCRAMKRAGWRIDVLTDGFDETKIEGITVRGLGKLRSLGRYSKHVINEVGKLRPNAVVQLLGTAGIFPERRFETPTIGVLTSPLYDIGEMKRFGLSTITRSLRQHLIGASMWRKSVKTAAHQNDAIIVLSEENRAKLLRRGIGKSKVNLVPVGVDDIFKSGKRPSKCSDVVFLGSSDSIRGLDTLLDAWRLVKNKKGKLILLMRDSKNIQADSDVEVIKGFLDMKDVYEHIRDARAVALPFALVPSDVPIAILEGMACGKPVVSTTVDGIPKLLDGRGIVVEPNDSKQLAAAIERIYGDDTFADALGVRAAAFARKLRWADSGKQFVKIVREVACA